jgi:hypothetical protein
MRVANRAPLGRPLALTVTTVNCADIRKANGTHVVTNTWIAQAQYFYTGVADNKYHCLGGKLLSVSVGDQILMVINTLGGGRGDRDKIGGGSGWTVTITAHPAARNSTSNTRIASTSTTSTINVLHPQLNPAYSWDRFPSNGIRPYAAFEAWGAPASDASDYPAAIWDVGLHTTSPDGTLPRYNVWGRSTGMVPTVTSNGTASWSYSPDGAASTA